MQHSAMTCAIARLGTLTWLKNTSDPPWLSETYQAQSGSAVAISLAALSTATRCFRSIGTPGLAL